MLQNNLMAFGLVMLKMRISAQYVNTETVGILGTVGFITTMHFITERIRTYSARVLYRGPVPFELSLYYLNFQRERDQYEIEK